MRREDQQSVEPEPAVPAGAARRGASLAVTALLAVVAAGFFAGTREEWPRAAGYVTRSAPSAPGVNARSYAELREHGLSPNAEIYRASRSALIAQLPPVTEVVPPRSAESRAQALARRAKGRAYDGAPPVIPHPTATRAEPNCLVCHEHGAQIAELRAPKMSHPAMQSCPQCHAEGHAEAPHARGHAEGQAVGAVQEAGPPVPLFAESDFVPLAFGGRGATAWKGAPPVVPHRGFLRERCDSCHGVSGALGLRTPHADRQSCVQCHVFDEDLDQGSFFSALRLRAALP